MVGSCEYGNETSCSINCVVFLCLIRNCQLLKNCSMKLVVNWFSQESPHYRTSQHRIRCDVNWINLAHDRGKWQARVNTVVNFPVP